VRNIGKVDSYVFSLHNSFVKRYFFIAFFSLTSSSSPVLVHSSRRHLLLHPLCQLEHDPVLLEGVVLLGGEVAKFGVQGSLARERPVATHHHGAAARGTRLHHFRGIGMAEKEEMG
jgi:hypothetical protein